MSGYGMSFYDYVHQYEQEDEQNRWRAVQSAIDRGHPAGPTSSDFQDAAAQISQEREQQCEWALREALTKGISIKNLEILCAATGISYDRVVMNTACEVPQTSLTHTHDKDWDMKIDQMMPSKWLKQSDVPEDKLVTVREIKKQNVAREDEEAEYKYTIFFEEFDKGMVLNSTNIKRLAKATGSDDSDDWTGKKVVLYVDPDIEYGGQVVGGLRIRPARKPSGATPKRTEDYDADPPF